MLEGFRNFIMRGNVLDLAVGVIIGAAFAAIVNSLVADIITPLIGMIFGQADYSAIKWGAMNIGKFLNSIVSFLLIALAVYFFIVVPVGRIQAMTKKPEAPAAPAAPPEDVMLLREIRDALKK